jgi:predicted acyl esterase
MHLQIGAALALAAVLAPTRAAAAPLPVTNTSLMLPTRDGTALHTRVFLPATLAPGQRVGTVLLRTPYGVDAAGSAGDLAAGYAAYGWAAVAQDERGRFASEGEYTFWRSSANDTFDLLAFIADQSWSNGLVAQTGTSANAIHGYVAPLAQPAPPTQLAAQFNCVGESILHQTTFQGGAYRQGLITGWLDLIGEAAFADEVVAHEAYGPWWGSTTQAAADGSEGAFALTNFPVLHTAGWFDIFSTSQIKTFEGLQAFGGPRARGSQILVVEAGGQGASLHQRILYECALEAQRTWPSVEAALGGAGWDMCTTFLEGDGGALDWHAEEWQPQGETMRHETTTTK